MRRGFALISVLMGLIAPSHALADGPIELSLTETVDLTVVRLDGLKSETYILDNLDLVADADLGALIGWRGAKLHAHLLNNLGGMPNDRAATLQGVNNIEVPSQRLRLFEAWIEQTFGDRTSVRVGLYDLNSEFYANDAAGLLIAPAFGVGSEIAATGANGPSIFPSTALGVRIDQQVGAQGYARVAVLNATAGTLGDPQGVDLSFDNGALLIGEAGLATDHAKLGLGGWGYTQRHDDVHATDGAGDPLRRNAWGVYAIAEATLRDAEQGPGVALFARAGVSDGRTTAFKGGWQAGVLISGVIPGRDDSQLSIGANQAFLSRGYRNLLADGGVASTAAETAFEITYSDQPAPWLTVQPDLQLVLDPGGEKGRGPALVAGVRTTFAF